MKKIPAVARLTLTACLVVSGCGRTDVFARWCEPATCASRHVECGVLPDGCGRLLDCGTCADGFVCETRSEARQCVPPCVPTTCEALGAACGTPGDGCGGSLDCGACPEGSECTGLRCGPPPLQLASVTVLGGPGEDALLGLGLDDEGNLYLLVTVRRISEDVPADADLGLGPRYDQGSYIVKRSPEGRTVRVTPIWAGFKTAVGSLAVAPDGRLRLVGELLAYPPYGAIEFWQEYDREGRVVAGETSSWPEYWREYSLGVVANEQGDFAIGLGRAVERVEGDGYLTYESVVHLDQKDGSRTTFQVTSPFPDSYMLLQVHRFDSRRNLLLLASGEGRSLVESPTDRLEVELPPDSIATLRLSMDGRIELASVFTFCFSISGDRRFVGLPKGRALVDLGRHNCGWAGQPGGPKYGILDPDGAPLPVPAWPHPDGWTRWFGGVVPYGEGALLASKPVEPRWLDVTVFAVDEQLRPVWEMSLMANPGRDDTTLPPWLAARHGRAFGALQFHQDFHSAIGTFQSAGGLDIAILEFARRP